ncbi:MAG: UDP-N-acetylmuramoyl-L-alanine--D-glutamate ligase [Ilumatobacteraceae bacterium]|nr:UDP-N-acetylmuramoyl-L-alanine--D-glutamate ligase [Ilumatobacteraceae bacterium]
MTITSLVHGLGIAGAATARAMQRLGHRVVVTDDVIDDAKVAEAARLGLEIEQPPTNLDQFVRSFDLISPAPGVAESHPLIRAARSADRRIASEIELAWMWERERTGGARPMVAVTGTDGKTTTVSMVAAMLESAGRRTVACGNTDTPLLDALEMDVDLYVVECSSFRLAFTEEFHAEAAIWLNLAPDHLNWHDSMATYEAAKAKIFHQQTPGDVSIGNIDDPIVRRHLAGSPGRKVSVGEGGDYRCIDGDLVCPAGVIIGAREMRRSLPHDISNGLAAAASVLETGLATVDEVAGALAAFEAPAHRISLVGRVDGIECFNDSKATTPHAALAAIRSFPSIVLIAGGRNKDLDLSVLAEARDHIRGVIAIGEAAAEIEAVFAPGVPVRHAGSMESAVRAAIEEASNGDVVLLSPACASFDWYPAGGYAARGEHFARVVDDLARAGVMVKGA